MNYSTAIQRQASESINSDPISVTHLFTIGIGPSSSHTIGPMRAAEQFRRELEAAKFDRVVVELFGSLALTGKGHGTDTAIMLGLSGYLPESIDPEQISKILRRIRARKTIKINSIEIDFNENIHIVFRKKEFLQRHSNGMRFTAFEGYEISKRQTFYSVGGGTVLGDETNQVTKSPSPNIALRFPFDSAKSLIAVSDYTNLSFAEIVERNEEAWRSRSETYLFLDTVRNAMLASIKRGCQREGWLPGSLRVKRRAAVLFKELRAKKRDSSDGLAALDWVSLYALAVNEENAAGGRVVTAPTNGAAGVIPAVLKYFEKFCPVAKLQKSREFLLTAAAIGILYKKRASISAAEMGCQGEIGVACSMAAGALAAVLGGSNRQVANAAEIGMEHNLGLTCDPIGGFVQIPCIERNTMGAVKAITAARLALKGNGQHVVSLDAVIETMRQTGRDMSAKYKETSLGGLAVNVVDC